MTKKKALFVFGTRPEAIKMAPLIREFIQQDKFETRVCLTGQHKEMLHQVISFFDIPFHHDLELMRPNQSLAGLTSRLFDKLDVVFEKENPDLVLVQGDTTSVMAAALVAFYRKIPVAHVEAGLRSHDMWAPFPEELNRRIASLATKYHLAPTPLAAEYLKKENFTQQVSVTGNTVIDALFLCLDILKAGDKYPMANEHQERVKGNPFVLMTCHRRENFGQPIKDIFNSLKKYAENHPGMRVIYPVHLNPNVQGPAKEILSDVPNVELIDPLGYPELVWYMSHCEFVLTDSGGIQEEAPSLGKPVLVLREVTERTEAVDAGTAKLVGANADLIYTEMDRLTTDKDYYKTFAEKHNPYGDGTACRQIHKLLAEDFYA